MVRDYNPKRYRAPSQTDALQSLRQDLRRTEARVKEASERAMHYRNIAVHLFINGGPCTRACDICADIRREVEDID